MRKNTSRFQILKEQKRPEASFCGWGQGCFLGLIGWDAPGISKHQLLALPNHQCGPPEKLESPFVKWDSLTNSSPRHVCFLKQIPAMQTKTSSQLLLDWILDNQIRYVPFQGAWSSHTHLFQKGAYSSLKHKKKPSPFQHFTREMYLPLTVILVSRVQESSPGKENWTCHNLSSIMRRIRVTNRW